MIQSLVKARNILSCFSTHSPRLTLSELSAMTGYPRTTLYTLAATLVELGFLEKEGERYALGTAIVTLAQLARVNVEIRDRAAPILRVLAEESRSSVYLTIPDGDSILYIYAIESSRRLQARSAIGARAHYHSTAVGKAMLAFMPSGRVDAIMDRVGLPGVTGRTIVDREQLLEELELVRRVGYAHDHGENEEGVCCVSAPVFDDRARVVASCSVSGACEQLAEIEASSKAVMAAAHEVSRRMGYVPERTGDYYAPSTGKE